MQRCDITPCSTGLVRPSGHMRLRRVLLGFAPFGHSLVPLWATQLSSTSKSDAALQYHSVFYGIGAAIRAHAPAARIVGVRSLRSLTFILVFFIGERFVTASVTN
jgi:hypothetical protein